MKLKKLWLFMAACTLTGSNNVFAQVENTDADTTHSTLVRLTQDIEGLKKLKVSGYIQAQFQYADSSGQPSFNGGNFASGTDKRFMIRRGRIKFQYDALPNEKGISTSQYVMQFDVTEKGLTIKDAYVKLTDKWIGWASLTAGMQNRPFGNEISYSSNLRESPERGRMSQIIFPGERELGALLTIQGPKTSTWNWLKLDAGVFNGNGAPGVGRDVSDFDKKKDIIARLSMSKSTGSENVKYGLGFSYYDGGYRIDTVNVYKVGKDTAGVMGMEIETKKSDIALTPVSSRNFSKRMYLGVDAQVSVNWAGGITTLRGEYIEGKQPGSASSTASPNTNTPNILDIYNRNFNGGYFYFLQNILQTPLQLIVKYDWYDPNTEVEGDDIGKKASVNGNGTALKSFGAADLKYETWGFGLAYRWDANVKVTAYYDMVTNEKSANLSGYTKDLTDNQFTLRLQVRF